MNEWIKFITNELNLLKTVKLNLIKCFFLTKQTSFKQPLTP